MAAGEFFANLVTNKIFVAVLFATVTSQIIKTLIWSFKHKRIKLEIFYKGYGGFPSSHTAFVTALTVGIWKMEGFSSLFFVTLAMAVLWVSYVVDLKLGFDLSADYLHSLLKVLEKPDFKKFDVVVGHSYSQVIIGFVVGFVVALLVFL